MKESSTERNLVFIKDNPSIAIEMDKRIRDKFSLLLLDFYKSFKVLGILPG